MSKEAMKLALEALKDAYSPDPHPAIKALEEALANHIPDDTKMVSGVKDSLTTQQEQGKPVAWWVPKAEQFCLQDPSGERPFAKAWEPLYTTPQQRTWVGLTEKEVREVWSNFNSGLDTAMNFYNAVEAKLKEKNT